MTRRLVLALVLVMAAAGCTRNAGQVEREPPIPSFSPTASPTPSPTPPAMPVALEGPVNNKGVSDLTGMGNAVTVEFTMADFAFAPTFVKTVPGANLKLRLKNPGGLADHTFNIDSLGIHRQLKPGENAELVVQLPTSGAFRFYCKLHVEKGMQGAFFFTEGDPVSTVSIPPVTPPASRPRAASTTRRNTSSPTPSATSSSEIPDDDNDVDIPDMDDIIQEDDDGTIIEGQEGNEGQNGNEGAPGADGEQGAGEEET